MAKELPYSENPIPNLDADWGKDESDAKKRPYSKQAVQYFIKKEITLAKNRIERIEETIDVGNVSLTFRDMPSGNVVVNGSNAYMFPLYIRSVLIHDDGTEEPYDRNVNLTIEVIINGNTTTSVIGNVAANVRMSVNITPYVVDGCTFVLRITNNDGMTERSPYYDVIKANLGVATRENSWWAKPFTIDKPWIIPLNLDINVNAMLRATLTDSEGSIRSSVTIPSTSLSSVYDLTLPHPSENGGGNGVYQLKVELSATDESLSGLVATPLIYNVCCLSTESVENYLLINNVGTTFKNYNTNKMFEYAVHVGFGNPSICFRAFDGEIKLADSGALQISSDTVQTYNLSLEMERMDDSDFEVSVSAEIDEEEKYSNVFVFSNKDGYAATAGAEMLIRFNGRNNSEAARDIWYDTITGKAITPEITGVGYTGADGYHTEQVGDTLRTSFRILAGGRAVLPVTPIAMREDEARTIEFVYKVSNVRNFDSDVISCFDGTNGFRINSNEISLFTPSARQLDDQNAGVDYTDVMHVVIVVRPKPNNTDTTVDNFSCCQIYINGCRQRWFAFDRDLNVNKPITIGSDNADIDLFAIRIYNKILTEKEVEQNTCNMLFTEHERMTFKQRNAVREEGKVDFNRVRPMCNVIVFGCDELPSRAWSKTQTTEATIETYLWTEDGVTETVSNLAWQGTTSHNYGTNPEYGGLGQNYKWTAADGTKMCAKANWASSMQSHKIGLTAAYTDIAVACGVIPNGQRISILQRPMVGFQRKSDGSLMYIGLFTVGPDKGNKATFSWTGKSLFLEGKDNEPLGSNFLLPWNDDTVTVDSENETYSHCGVKSWEDASKKPEYINSVWKPAFNFVYESMQHILPFAGSVAELNADQSLSPSYSYWLTTDDEESEHVAYDLFYFNSTLNQWMFTDINMSEQLVDKGYGLSSADLEDKTDEEKNNLFKLARRTKFKKEVEVLFNKDFFIYHLAFIEFFGCTDNLTKNTYPFVLDCTGTDKRICWRQDDLDSSIATENQGKNYKKYCVEITDNYADYGRDNLMVFNGTENQFWFLVRECYASEIAMFMRERFIPSLVYGQAADSLTMFTQWCKRYFFDNAQNHFPEALYNENGRIRYGYGHLSSGYQYRNIALSQDSGNFYHAEKQWLRMRHIYMSSKYNVGSFAAGSKSDVFTTRPYADEQGIGNTFVITPAIYMYPSVQNGESIIRGERIWPGGEHASWSVTLPATQGDQEQRINGMSYISSLGPIYNAAIRGNVDVNGRMLVELNIGTRTDTENIRSRVTGLGIGDATSLQKLTLSNIATLQGVVDLTQCVSLKEMYADGTKVTSVPLCDGGPLETLYLPESISRIELVGKTNLSTLVLESLENVTNIRVEKCSDDILRQIIDYIQTLYD